MNNVVSSETSFTKNEVTLLLTCIDISLRNHGLKIMEWPDGFAAIDVVCKKLEKLQFALDV